MQFSALRTVPGSAAGNCKATLHQHKGTRTLVTCKQDQSRRETSIDGEAASQKHTLFATAYRQ